MKTQYIHKFLLHFIYTPRINHVIDSFVAAWNCHPIRSERNWSPEKLWANGVLDKRNQDVSHLSELYAEDVSIDLEWFGMDWHAPSLNDDGLSTVDVFEAVNPLREEEFLHL